MNTLLISDSADFHREVDQRLHQMLADQWDEPQQYEPPTYPYHPHIRLRRYEGDR